MGNQITIFKGDEHRAKIEREYQKGDFFDDVYFRAHKAFDKILREADDYVNENEACGYRIKYQGMGNNIIMFTSGRGQGKTSAMQSYAEFLRNADTDNKGVLKKIEDRHFTVLDAIDPTSLDKNENLIRVLLSRLFLMLEKPQNCARDCCRRGVDDRQKREALLKLFRDCYDSIEVLREGRNKEYLQDDLEHLAQIGNSARLKADLHSLIEKFLEYITPEDKYTKKNMLVVQIDDADLFSENVFEICEDVYHYLSIPNVVVLMAADFIQLRYCLSERYLRLHKELQDVRSGVDIYDKCREMAVRYLEKVFPDRQRIDLPVLDEMTVFDYGRLEIIYKVKNTKSDEDCPEKIYDYLLKRIYNKTGIILLNTQNMIHPLLPHTLRELTHFLNLLDEMPVINFQRACSYIDSESLSEECMEEISNLKNNLQRLKQYFLNDWCPNNLNESQLSLVCNIDICERNRKLEMTVSLLNKYLKSAEEGCLEVEKDVTYHNVMMAIDKCPDLRQHVKLQYALFFYYTLFLNEWFADAMDSPVELSSFTEFVQAAVYWEKSVLVEKSAEYIINQFDFSLVKLEEFLRVRGKTILTANGSYWLETFTDILGYDVITHEMINDKDDRDSNIYRWFTAVRSKYPDMVNARFDVFRAPVSILLNANWENAAEQLAKEVNLSDMVSQSKEDLLTEEDKKFNIHVSIKNVLTNVEVQQSIERRIGILRRSRTKGSAWLPDVESVCGELDTWINKTIYHDIVPMGLGTTVKTLLNSNAELIKNTLFFALLLCNSENLEKYCNEYKKCIRKKIGLILDYLDATRKITYLNKKYLTVLAEEMKVSRLSDSDWGEIYPKAFGDPAGIGIAEIELLNNYCESIRKGYEKIDNIHMEYLTELDQTKAVKETKSAELLREGIDIFKKALMEIDTKCEEPVNASNKRKP